MKKHVEAISKAFDQLKELVGDAVGERGCVVRPIVTRTGVISLDLVLGGGLPPGITEIFGPESVGKTTLLGSILRTAQAQEKYTAVLPSEHHEVEFLKELGVDPEKLLLIQAQSAHEALGAVADLISTANVVVAIDSLTSLQGSLKEDEWAQLRWDFLSRAGEEISRNSSLIIVSQVRTRRSADPRKRYTNETESANRRVTDLFTVRLDVRRTAVTENDYEMMVDVVTNLYGLPANIVQIPAEKKWGIRYDLDFLRTAVLRGIVQQVGAWYYLTSGDVKFGPGADKAASQLMSNSMAKNEVLRIVYP